MAPTHSQEVDVVEVCRTSAFSASWYLGASSNAMVEIGSLLDWEWISLSLVFEN